MHISHTFFFLHYFEEINTIMILKFKMKKWRHGVVQYLAQNHTAIKWGNLEWSQEADLQTPHSTTNLVLKFLYAHMWNKHTKAYVF